ncbi:hypothetical protein EON65_25660 [archaeon]|nr:MAG: hypothetical protein EON65_25660 [archaeon]
MCERTSIGEISESVWQIISTHYSESHRHYHNLEHIYEMFTNLDLVDNIFTLNDRDVVEFAIFFHDIIYDPSAINNEEASAQLFQHLLSSHLPEDTIDKVFRYIEATKAHNCDDLSDLDLCMFLDLDLLILASAPERYLRYAQSIRQEYLVYSDEDYRVGRIRVLQSFLHPDKTLFFTQSISTMFGDKARENITSELEHLKSTGLL